VWLADEFEAVSAALPMVSARDRSTDAEDSFVVRFSTRNGVEGVITQTGAGWGPVVATTAVAGTDGTVWLADDEAWLADRTGTHRLDPPAGLVASTLAPSDDPAHRFTHLELVPYTHLTSALARAARREPVADPAGVPLPTFADGLAEVLVLDAIRESAAAQGRLVQVSR
jgi:predicted dehydrogenase